MSVIVFEGLNGVGKTTLFNRVQVECILNNIKYIEFMKFPSSNVKPYLLNYEAKGVKGNFLDLSLMCVDDFADYFIAKRRHLSARRRSLEETTFIFDRYIFSTFFYHYAHQKDTDELETISRYFHILHLPAPDLIVWIESHIDNEYLQRRYPNIDILRTYQEEFTIIKEVFDKHFPTTEWITFYNHKNINSMNEFLKIIKKI